MSKPVIFLNSHPIQYFAPLYRQIHSDNRVPLIVWYCSDESIRGKMDKGFGKEVKWDIPLLDGYESVFLKNRSWKPSIHKGFWGLFNPGIVHELYKQPKSVLIVHGWAYATNIMAIVFGKLFGHQVCLRSETPYNQELQKNKTITFVKHLYLRFLFFFIDRFLYIGKQNQLFYRSLGVKEKALVFVPYSVDNKRFREMYESTGKAQAAKITGIPEGKKVILYSGKYISKKRPLDLLKAFKQIAGKTEAMLVMVGEGECRPVMETYICENRLEDKVVLTGFINQSLIPMYYRAADIFVMCSGLGETWGLSVNEAMNFGLPVIVSDTCGSAYDLVEHGMNGAVFETGNIDQLAALLEEYLGKNNEEVSAISKVAIQKIDMYSYDQIIRAIESIT